MKYIIRATSSRSDEFFEDLGAKKERLPYKKYWYDEGNKLETQDLEFEAYTLEINSLEELHQLISKADNPIIISDPDDRGFGFALPDIEIYDMLRE